MFFIVNELTIYEFKLKYTEVYTSEAILTFPLPKIWANMTKEKEYREHKINIFNFF